MPAEEKTKKVCHCDPATVKIQEYQRSVLIVVPEFITLGNARDTVCIDACLVSEVWDLWRAGIRTTGCCCGHNQTDPYIGVEEEDIQKMKEMGYVVRVNPLDSSREDSFYPKTLNKEEKQSADGIIEWEEWEEEIKNTEKDYPMIIENWSIEDWIDYIKKLLRRQAEATKKDLLTTILADQHKSELQGKGYDFYLGVIF
jgi:hypothetical protein